MGQRPGDVLSLFWQALRALSAWQQVPVADMARRLLAQTAEDRHRMKLEYNAAWASR